MKPLEPFRNSMTVISELCDPQDGHATTVAAWLSGTIPFRTIAENVRGGVTIAQTLASKFALNAPLRSMELSTEASTGWIGGCAPQSSCSYMTTISWKNEAT